MRPPNRCRALGQVAQAGPQEEPLSELFESFVVPLVIVTGLIRHEERVLSDDARVRALAGDGDNFRQPGLPCWDQRAERQPFRIIREGSRATLRACLEL